MKCKLLFISFLVLICNYSIAQIHIVDSIDNAPIPFVHIISENGIIIGTSNIGGIIDIQNNVSIQNVKNSSISFHHISYQNKDVEVNSLSNTDTIKLNQRDVLISEIKVTNKSEPVYLVLKGFFRSYQIENGTPKYYTDGIVEYYISKNKLKNRVIMNRSFRNKKLVEADKKRINTIRMIVACTPYINAKPQIDELNSDYSFETINDKKIIKKENVNVGLMNLDKQSGLIELNIDLIAPAKESVSSLFNYTSKITSINITENYSSSDLTNIQKDDLINRKEYRKIFFKHKKDKGFIEIDALHEFYVFEKKYLYKSDLKEVDHSNNFSLKESSSYSTEYWNELNKYSIEKLPSDIEKLLGTTLEGY